MMINGYLLRTDAHGRLIPDLATVVPTVSNGGISTDLRIITYHLRRGIRWQDGQPFDARDVAFSFALAMNPKVSVPDRSGYDDIQRVDVMGNYTVRVQLRQPYSPSVATFFALSANEFILFFRDISWQVCLISIKRCTTNILSGSDRIKWSNGVTEIVSSSNVTDTIFVVSHLSNESSAWIMPNSTSLGVAWETGELDLLELTGNLSLLKVVRTTNAVITFYPRSTFNYLLFQNERPPLNDIRVRQAIVAALDRDAIMHSALGYFYLSADGDRLPGTFAYNPAIRQPRYDPQQAETLLNAAGWRRVGNVRMKHGVVLSLQLVTSTEAMYRRIAVIAQGWLQQAGIDTTIRVIPVAQLYAPQANSGVLAIGRYDLFWGVGIPGGVHDTSYLYRCDMRPPNGENYARICDPVIDEAARIELTTADPQREAIADQEIQRRLISNANLVFLGFVKGAVATRPGFEGYHPSWIARNGWNAWQWHWTNVPIRR